MEFGQPQPPLPPARVFGTTVYFKLKAFQVVSIPIPIPLPRAPVRQLLHSRHVHYQGFEREDGQFDLEAKLLDTKPFAIDLEGEGTLVAGQPLHGMRLRLTIDLQFIVHELEVAMVIALHGECQAAREPVRP